MSSKANRVVLGIETSCDETAAALVRSDRTVLADRVWSQLDQHATFGGVVPELAARSHATRLDKLIAETLRAAEVDFDQLDGIAVTAGPGLIGGLIVGMVTARAISVAHSIAFLPINHLEAHALTGRLIRRIEFPYLALLVSGGHCQFVVVEAPRQYEVLGGTIDDSIGEAFDKVAKMLGLGYPGGPAVETAALDGNRDRFNLPRPLVGTNCCDFSFSGLKTAVRLEILRDPQAFSSDGAKSDLCASFQASVCEILEDRTRKAIKQFNRRYRKLEHLVVAGGVAANQQIRSRLAAVCREGNFDLVAPPLSLCGDNAVMVAWAGMEIFRLPQTETGPIAAQARWPLATMRRM